jgi:adenylosuccinate synthase
MRSHLAARHRIIIEGTQGFGLSLLHSTEYPYVTSRDTTAATFVSEAGLSPLDVDQIVLVLRAFPIRVSGNSGPLPNEIDWQIVSLESGSSVPIVEFTSVTKSIRRVAHFHPDVVRQAIMVNRPTHIVLNHLDYIDNSCCTLNSLSAKAFRFVEEVESAIDTQIDISDSDHLHS